MSLPELFANPAVPGVPSSLGALSAAMTTTPAAGTVESWAVSASAPSALQASVGQFRVIVDSEVMIVAASVSGASPWLFTRGAEGSTVTTHAAGVAITHVLTQGALAAFAQTTSPAFTGTPTAPTQSPLDNSTRIGTTAYSDAAVAAEAAIARAAEAALSAGMEYKAAVKWATTAALPANVYNNGASGVGATLTGVALGALPVDGSTPAPGDRVLVKNEAAPANNGFYLVTTVGSVGAAYVLTRTADYNQSAEIQNGDVVSVSAGVANTNTSWIMTTSGVITVGTTAIVWGPAPANVVGTAGQVVVTGNVVSLSPSVGTMSGLPAGAGLVPLSTGTTSNVAAWGAPTSGGVTLDGGASAASTTRTVDSGTSPTSAYSLTFDGGGA